MSANTKIEWTEATWSPVTGCTRVSDGCLNCYIERQPPFRMAHRRFDRYGIGGTTGVSLHPERLRIPLSWRKPQRIFVCSMADLFHDEVPDDYIAQVFAVMAMAQQHTFQVLTKRHARMRSLLSSTEFWTEVGSHGRGIAFERAAGKYPAAGPMALTPDSSARGHWTAAQPLPNVWLGVSTENQRLADIRIPALLDTPAAVRFISAEPLLGPIDLDIPRCEWHDRDELWTDDNREERCQACTDDGGRGELSYGHWLDACPENDCGINWVIVGGESGPRARPMHPAWARDIQRQCAAADVPFLFKQWGDWTPLAPLVDGKFDFSRGITMTDDGITYNRGDLDYPDGPRRGEAMRADFPHHHPTSMYRLGKRRAGRELYHDGRTWDEYPSG